MRDGDSVGALDEVFVKNRIGWAGCDRRIILGGNGHNLAILYSGLMKNNFREIIPRAHTFVGE